MKNFALIIFFILNCFLIVLAGPQNSTKPVSNALSIDYLRVNTTVNPLGIDDFSPAFSWVVRSNERGTLQTAYEILVSSDEKKLEAGIGNSWQTGKVTSQSTFGIKYNGKTLPSFTKYYWKVRIWNQMDQVSEWSPVCWFETSAMKPSDWKARWISDQRPLPSKDEDFYLETPNTLLRKEINLKKEVRSARLYVAGLGYSIAYLNGQRVGDHMLDMPWTQFAKQVTYNTFDVTQMVQKGENAIGVMLGNGWYNPMPIKLFRTWNFRNTLTIGKPCLKAQLRITYNDGSIETIVTDESWKAGDGPVLKNSVYLGELYDARQEQKEWNKPSFDNKGWQNTKLIEGPKGQLIARYMPPVRATKILKPVKITEPKPGVFLFDFGQNFAGVARLKVKGTAGTKVVMRSGEDIHADGTLNFLTVIAGQLKAMWNLKGGPGSPDDPMMINTYILKGDGDEVFTPEFTFSSFRYVEVNGFPGKPNLNSVEGLRMNTDLQKTGSFECSNELFNKVQEATKWTFLSNVFSVQSDCPAREKLGYGADLVTTAEAFSYNFDMSNFYRKVVQDFVNDVRPNGGMPEIAPNVGINDQGMGDDTGSPGWQLAFPFGMKVLYDYYGDTRTVEKNYDMLKKQIDFMHLVTPDNIVQNCIGDHESIDKKPIALSATAFYYHHVIILAEFAQLLDKKEDATKYQQLADEIKSSFVKTFLKPGTGIFDTGTQAAQLIALNYCLVPENEKKAAFDRLIMEIYDKHKGHLSTGIFATKFMFDFFRQQNRNDVAYTIANQRSFPGWGNMIANGATTLYESWAYPDTVCSQNHPMFGSISEWYYKSLLGINSKAPGFTKFEIKPQPTGDLTWAKGYYDAITGKIVSDWKIEGVHFYLNVSIPANTTATVYVPSLPGKPVMESGQPAKSAIGLKFKEYNDSYAIFEAQGGNYGFESVFQK
ncbi:MAG TPA: family 78 glycoside hydrolase catalytic domain [Prolixibacteraceae bacterium]|nr:family 78 glycoside hydrolase catalytic domain [Prolixibacteraceae bacterium]